MAFCPGITVTTDKLNKEMKRPVVTKVEQTTIKQMTELDKHRTNIKEVIRWSNATPIRRSGDMGYMCCYCNDYYREPADLKKHTLENHPDIQKANFLKLNMEALIVRLDITSLRCKICELDLDTLEQLMEHLRNDHHKTIYTDIKNHIVPLKFITDTLQCCICMKSFTKFKILLEHMNSHYRNYICKICDMGFIYHACLRNHKHIHNSGTFKCDYCPLVFDTSAKKKAHGRAVHSAIERLHKCGYCNATFTAYCFKEAHLVSMHGLKVPEPKCQACDRVFKSRQSLRVHIKKDHLMERQHKCPECDMSFYSATNLKEHMAKHTGSRSHKCKVCSKTLGKGASMREHMKIHYGVKPFKCEHCQREFSLGSSWKRHMKSEHSETMQFK